MRRPAVRQAGVALLAMMILVMVITLTLGSIFYRHQLDVAQAIRIGHGDQAFLLALSGESWARQVLEEDRAGSEQDSLDEIWARAVPLLPVEGGTLTGCIIDLQSRFNLNNFATYTSERWASETESGTRDFASHYLALLQTLGLPTDAGRVAVLIDWIDPDNDLVDTAGAEQQDYGYLQPPRLVANQKLVDVAELADLVGYDIGAVAFLGDVVTVLPSETAININTASPVVLRAMGGEWGEVFVDTVMDFRPFANVDDFYLTLVERLGLAGVPEAQASIPASLIAVATDYFRMNLEARIGQARVELQSTLHRQASGGVAVIKRNLTFVPDIELESVDEDKAGAPVRPLCPPQGGVPAKSPSRNSLL